MILNIKNLIIMKTGNRSLISSSQTFQATPKTSFLIPQGELELFHYMMDHIGDEVLVVRRAPLGDPIEIEVMGYRLVLRRNEASQVSVRELP